MKTQGYYKGMRLKRYTPVLIICVLLLTAVLPFCSVQAQEETDELSAEINAAIIGDIPSVKITEWTPINISIEDAFGIDWDRLKDLIPEWRMRLLWPFIPAFPQPVQRFLGYTSLRLEPDIVEGNPKGWYVRVNPSAIPETNPGYVHPVTLEVRTDDSAIDYSVVVGIKCTRIDTLGGEIGESTIYVPVKASPTNFVEMRADRTTKTVGLKSMVYFTLDIVNNGYYKDVFQFELDAENGLMGLFQEQAIVLNPGETQRVTLGILTPETFFDPGTPNKVDVYVYSTGDSARTLVGSLVVYTQGFYISPLVGIILVPIIVVVILIYLFFFYFREKRDRERYGKPDKPWTIPEEKQYLEELKEKDKAEYERVLQMMDDEYRSALLWYESYRRAMKRQEQVEKIRQQKPKKDKNNNEVLKNFFKKPKQGASAEAEQETAPEQKVTDEEVPQEQPAVLEDEKPESMEQHDQTIERKAEDAQRKKERTLLRIKREQEKQRRKKRK